jgi:hypothetical protein
MKLPASHLTVLTILAALLMVACGGTSPSSTAKTANNKQPGTSASQAPGTQKSLDACTEVSDSTAARISGAPGMVKQAGTNAGGISECIYVDNSSGAGVVILIEQIPGVVGGAAMQAAMAQASHDSSGNQVPVSGIGDQAFKEVEDNSSTLAFAKGGTLAVLAVSSSSREGTAIEADLEGICRQIASHL